MNLLRTGPKRYSFRWSFPRLPGAHSWQQAVMSVGYDGTATGQTCVAIGRLTSPSGTGQIDTALPVLTVVRLINDSSDSFVSGQSPF